MSNSYWGPKTWKTLHCITYNFPENSNREINKIYIHFFNRIVPTMLPCSICFNHYLKYISNHPVHNHIQNKNSLIRWLIDMHNYINKKNGKAILSYEQVDSIYKNKIYVNEINQIILFNRKRAQYGYLKVNFLNQLIYFLNLTLFKLIPNTYSGVIKI